MLLNKQISLLLAVGAIAAQGSAQSLSGTVSALAHVTKGSYPGTVYANLPAGQTAISIANSDAGPNVNADCLSRIQPGFAFAAYSGISTPSGPKLGTPYGEGQAAATIRDGIRWNGTAPIKMKLHIENRTVCQITGSNPGQTSAGTYSNLTFTGNGIAINQVRQESYGMAPRPPLYDVEVTLQPGKWYSLYMQVKGYGDTQDSTSPYSDTTSNGSASLTAWFEPLEAVPGSIQSVSGHTYLTPVYSSQQIVAMATPWFDVV